MKGARDALLPLYTIALGERPDSPQHLALSARTRAEVDKFAEWAFKGEVRIASGPKSYPEYRRDYDAVFSLVRSGCGLSSYT